jgi:valyl-tRNA synthetase
VLDQAAMADVEWLKAVISGLRSARTELNLPPSKSLPLFIDQGEPTDRERMERLGSLVARLARLDTIEWLEGGDHNQSDGCSVTLVGQMRLLIPLAGLVDVSEELERLNKLLEREQQLLTATQKKLENERFVANAPTEVVNKERSRLSQHQHAVAELSAQIKTLSALS